MNNTFTDAIAKTFYDKDFDIAQQTRTTDGEGGATTTIGSYVSYKGNVQPSLNERLVAEYGITSQVDIAITCDTSVSVQNDDVIKYKSKEYTVTSVKDFDSHKLIIGSIR